MHRSSSTLLECQAHMKQLAAWTTRRHAARSARAILYLAVLVMPFG